MTDLEDDLRAALRARADELTAADLRRPFLDDQSRARGRRGPLLAALATAACVAAGGVGIAVWHPHTGAPADGTFAGHPVKTGSRPSDIDPGFTGALSNSMWSLVKVTHGGKVTTIPDRIGARLTFAPHGRIVAYDGVNTASASCAVRADGTLVFGPAATTAIGYVGHDPAVLTAVDSIGALLQGGGTGAVEREHGLDRLTVRTAGYTLVLDATAVALGGTTTKGSGNPDVVSSTRAASPPASR